MGTSPELNVGSDGASDSRRQRDGEEHGECFFNALSPKNGNSAWNANLSASRHRDVRQHTLHAITNAPAGDDVRRDRLKPESGPENVVIGFVAAFHSNLPPN